MTISSGACLSWYIARVLLIILVLVIITALFSPVVVYPPSIALDTLGLGGGNEQTLQQGIPQLSGGRFIL
jgi:hypothetical protein